MNSSLKEYEQAHMDNYLKAIQELIKNNTHALIYDDIFPLFDKPPLDSMDLIKNKLLSLAKNNKIILHTEKVSSILEEYQNAMKKCVEKIGNIREEALAKILQKFEQGEEETIRIFKKDLVQLDKELKKAFKEALQKNCSQYLTPNLSLLFKEDQAITSLETMEKEMQNFLEKKYTKQILESIDIKILVKDTTLLNGVKEQTNRYLFTKNNSHLFD